MASSITLPGDWLVSLGNRRMTKGTGNLGTYTSGGIAVTAVQVGLGQIDELLINPAAGYVFEYDKANGKVKAYQQDGTTGALAQVGSVDLSGVTFRWQAIGM